MYDIVKRYLIKYRDIGCFCSVYVRARSAVEAVRMLEHYLNRFVDVTAMYEVPDE